MMIAASVLLALGLFAYVFAPVRADQLAHGVKKTRLMYLRERKEVVYENLRDLNFEYRAGKLPDADYHALRSGLESEAAAVLAEIEDLESGRKS